MLRNALITWDSLQIFELERMHPDFDQYQPAPTRCGRLRGDHSKEMRDQMNVYHRFTSAGKETRFKQLWKKEGSE